MDCYNYYNNTMVSVSESCTQKSSSSSASRRRPYTCACPTMASTTCGCSHVPVGPARPLAPSRPPLARSAMIPLPPLRPKRALRRTNCTMRQSAACCSKRAASRPTPYCLRAHPPQAAANESCCSRPSLPPSTTALTVRFTCSVFSVYLYVYYTPAVILNMNH